MIRSLLARLVAVILMMTAVPVMADDVERGRQVFVDRDLGHCVLCHAVAQLDVPFQGNIGPELSDVALRLSPGQIRAKIVDPSISNPQTTMPGYQRTHDLRQVSSAFVGKPVLNDRQMNDLLVFIGTLTAVQEQPDDTP